jgi:hypothetical protein
MASYHNGKSNSRAAQGAEKFQAKMDGAMFCMKKIEELEEKISHLEIGSSEYINHKHILDLYKEWVDNTKMTYNAKKGFGFA